MTIDEAVHRIVRGHWLLIAICILLPVAAVTFLGLRQPVMYEAVGRLQFGTALASSNVQADAASSRALGIVTSPSVVERALAEAGLHVDPVQFARDHIDLRRIGLSPIIEVAVSQDTPDRAVVIAKSLTNQLLDFSNAGDRKSETDRVVSLDSTIVTLTEQRDALIPRLAKASLGQQLSLQAHINAIQTTLVDDLRQRSDLIVAAASRSSTVLLDAVRTPTASMSKGIKQAAVLAALLGLIGGLGLAALLETLRPTLRNPKAISYAVGAPVIGHLALKDMESPRLAAALNSIADRMALLGLRYGSTEAMLLSVRSSDQARADELAEALGVNGDSATSHRLRVAALNGHWIEPGKDPGIVIFSPDGIRARELRTVQALIDSVDWPVLGVVTYDRNRRFTLLRGAYQVARGRIG